MARRWKFALATLCMSLFAVMLGSLAYASGSSPKDTEPTETSTYPPSTPSETPDLISTATATAMVTDTPQGPLPFCWIYITPLPGTPLPCIPEQLPEPGTPTETSTDEPTLTQTSTPTPNSTATLIPSSTATPTSTPQPKMLFLPIITQ